MGGCSPSSWPAQLGGLLVADLQHGSSDLPALPQTPGALGGAQAEVGMYRAMWETAMDDVLEVRRSPAGAPGQRLRRACQHARQRGAIKNNVVPAGRQRDLQTRE